MILADRPPCQGLGQGKNHCGHRPTSFCLPYFWCYERGYTNSTTRSCQSRAQAEGRQGVVEKGAREEPGSAASGCGTQPTHLLILGLVFSPVKWRVVVAHSPKSLPDLKFYPPFHPRRETRTSQGKWDEPSLSVDSGSTIHFHGQQK